MINLNLNTITDSTENQFTIDLDNFYSLVSDFNDQMFITKADINEITDMIAIQNAIIESESFESIMPIINRHNKLHITLGISDDVLTGRSAAGIRDYYVDSIGSWIVDKLKWLLDKLIEFFKWCWTKFKSLFAVSIPQSKDTFNKAAKYINTAPHIVYAKPIECYSMKDLLYRMGSLNVVADALVKELEVHRTAFQNALKQVMAAKPNEHPNVHIMNTCIIMGSGEYTAEKMCDRLTPNQLANSVYRGMININTTTGIECVDEPIKLSINTPKDFDVTSNSHAEFEHAYSKLQTACANITGHSKFYVDNLPMIKQAFIEMQQNNMFSDPTSAGYIQAYFGYIAMITKIETAIAKLMAKYVNIFLTIGTTINSASGGKTNLLSGNSGKIITTISQMPNVM